MGLTLLLLFRAQHIHAHHGADDGGVMLLIEARRNAQAIRVFAHEEITHASPFVRDVSKQAIFRSDGKVPIPEVAVNFDIGKALHGQV